jgi:hypothetical protein
MERRYLFEYNGKLYERGTKITISHNNDTVDVFFNYETTDIPKVEVYYDNMKLCLMPKEMFCKKIINISDTVDNRFLQLDVRNKRPTLKNEISTVDGMLPAWIWYVVLMLTWTIFKENIGLWIFTTYVFAKYRNNKLEQLGYKK